MAYQPYTKESAEKIIKDFQNLLMEADNFPRDKDPSDYRMFWSGLRGVGASLLGLTNYFKDIIELKAEEEVRMVDTPQDETIKDVKRVSLIRPKGTCGCGRSPTGDCIGWHRLTEEGHTEMFEKWQKASQGFLTFKERDEFFENNKVPKKLKE